MTFSRYAKHRSEHFEPEADLDPETQRRLRGILEKIDYTAFASNREVLGSALRAVEEDRLQRLAVAAAQARALWVSAGLEIADTGSAPSPAEVERLAGLRDAYDEFSAAYEALRRMVERGYVKLLPATKAAG